MLHRITTHLVICPPAGQLTLQGHVPEVEVITAAALRKRREREHSEDVRVLDVPRGTGYFGCCAGSPRIALPLPAVVSFRGRLFSRFGYAQNPFVRAAIDRANGMRQSQ
jgi:hypothetical protein